MYICKKLEIETTNRVEQITQERCLVAFGSLPEDLEPSQPW